jgi:proteic killer suppression protein
MHNRSGYDASVIKSFKHKGLSELFTTGGARKIQPKHTARLNLILGLLDIATNAGQMNAPGLRMHPLKGKPAGRYAVWVDENFRVVFRFEAGDAVEVDYVDYH